MSKIVKSCQKLMKIVKSVKNCQNCWKSSKLSEIVKIIENCQKISKFSIFFLKKRSKLSIRSCLLISLIECLKGHKSLGSLCSVVKTLIVSGNRPSKGQTRSPIELFWTAKKFDLRLKSRWKLVDQAKELAKSGDVY